jgi:hypothetical protein
MRRLCLLLLLSGCPDRPSAPAVEDKPVASSVPAAGDKPPPDGGRAAGGDPARALAAAMAAANEAHGATACERAYDGYRQMKSAVEHARPAPAIAGHDVFVATCGQLPALVQQCLDLKYSVAHAKECQEAQGHLDPALQAKLQTLIVK